MPNALTPLTSEGQHVLVPDGLCKPLQMKALHLRWLQVCLAACNSRLRLGVSLLHQC